MSILWIEEWGTLTSDANGIEAQVPHDHVARTQLTFTATAARTSFDFDSKTTYIVIYSEVNAYFLLGDSTVTADQNSLYLPAGTFRSIGLSAGQDRISAVRRA